MADNAALSPFDYQESTAPQIGYSYTGSGQDFCISEDSVSPQFHLYAHPVSGSFPIYEMIEDDGSRHLTWDPYATGVVKTYDGTIAGMQLLGFALRTADADTTKYQYDSLDTVMAAASGNYLAAGESLSVQVSPPDMVAPRILDVLVGSTQWDQPLSPAFIDLVDGDDDSGLGATMVGQNQLDSIPWVNVNQIHIVFNDDVSETFDSQHVKLFGVNVADYSAKLTFDFDTETNVGTITTSSYLTSDKLRLKILDTLTDAAGNALDGEWDDASSSTSGDQDAGGTFEFRLNVLPGDVVSTGFVLSDDFTSVRDAQGTFATGDFNPRFDVTGSGIALSDDATGARDLQGTYLPLADPTDFGLVSALGDITAVPTLFADDTSPTTTSVGAAELKAVYFDALDYQGSPTRVHAYVGIPAGASAAAPVPAVVLVHGGGGTAYSTWAQKWMDRGYAAISIAVEGQTDVQASVGGWQQHAQPGPSRVGIYGDSDANLTDQWMYHAVANTVLANNLMRSLDVVDAEKVGVMRISWAGVITSTVIGIDDRFKFAIPVYGSGHLYDVENHYGTVLGTNEVYKQVWDPILRADQATMPTQWLSWPRENNFSLDSQVATYHAVSGQRMVTLIPGLGHGHALAWNPSDSYEFADSVIATFTPWASQESVSLTGDLARVIFRSTKTLDQAKLISTTGTGYTGNLTWVEQSASQLDNLDGTWTITTTLPSGTTGWFLNRLSGDLVVSSDYQENIEVGFNPAGSLQLDHPTTADQTTRPVSLLFSGPTNVKVVEIQLSAQSHPGVFTTDATANPAVPLVLSSPAGYAIDITLDNTVAGLTLGGTATATLTVTWETLAGTTSSAKLPISAVVRDPSTVVYSTTANWSSKTIFDGDAVVINNGATVTLDQDDTAESVLVNNDSSPTTATLQIDQDVDLTLSGDLQLGAGTGAGVVNHSNGTVHAATITVNSSDSGYLSQYNLTGGKVTISGPLTLNSNGTLNLSGGLFTNNGTGTRTILTDTNGLGGVVHITGGTFTALGAAPSELLRLEADNISGGTVNAIGGQVWLANTTTLTVTGDAANITLDRLNLGVASRAATVNFNFGPTGISTIKNNAFLNLSEAIINIDGTQYTGGSSTFDLFTAPMWSVFRHR